MQVVNSIALILESKVSMDAPLMSMGLDSLGSVELLKELNRLAWTHETYVADFLHQSTPFNSV